MKNLLVFLFILSLISSCKLNTEPEHAEVTTKSLNGIWQFLASNDISENDVLKSTFSDWDTISVPKNWDTEAKYSEYKGKGYYQRSFNLPKDWSGKQVRLKFGAVYQKAKVWVNGKYLGEHIGGYTPFEFKITNNINFDKENAVLVMADNTYSRGAWWAWGGISRDVTLQMNDDVRFIYQHISAEPNFNTDEVKFNIKYKVENNSSANKTVLIQSEIENTSLDNLSVEIKSHSTSIGETSFVKKLSDYKLWDFNNPNLYELSSTLKLEGIAVNASSEKFGIRKFEARGEQFYLNNKAVRMNGVNRIHDHPDYGNTEPYELIKKDLLDIKSLGCNFSRLMHAPLSENILKFCDSIGFLLVEEIPVWGDDDPQSFPNNPQTKAWLKEMIERDFNHPSVVAWSVGNELHDKGMPWKNKTLSSDQYGYVNSMLDYIDTLDKTRLKTYVSLSTYRDGKKGNEPYDKIDFISINSYGNAIEHAIKTHEKFPNKPIFVSEIGKKQIGPAPNGRLDEDLLGYIEALKDLPYVTGVSIWSYNDYRSDYKGTPASGFRAWGIVDEHRNKKEAYQQLKAVYKTWQK